VVRVLLGSSVYEEPFEECIERFTTTARPPASGFDYNEFILNELGKAEYLNPYLDGAYLIAGRYY
jgi:hypothetical protein